MRWILAAVLCLVAGQTWGQTITLSGFTGAGGGWTGSTETFNGTWTSGEVKPIAAFRPIQPVHASIDPLTGLFRQNPVGGMVTATPNGSGMQITLWHNTGAGYVPFAIFGMVGTSGTVVIPRSPFDPAGPLRSITVQ